LAFRTAVIVHPTDLGTSRGGGVAALCVERTAGIAFQAGIVPNSIRIAGLGCLAGSFRQREFRLAQKTAIGFKGDPVPPGTASGAAEKRNSHRPRRFAVSANCSRSQLSNSGVPIEISIRK
jgi:hypothetical protein